MDATQPRRSDNALLSQYFTSLRTISGGIGVSSPGEYPDAKTVSRVHPSASSKAWKATRSPVRTLKYIYVFEVSFENDTSSGVFTREIPNYLNTSFLHAANLPPVHPGFLMLSLKLILAITSKTAGGLSGLF